MFIMFSSASVSSDFMALCKCCYYYYYYYYYIYAVAVALRLVCCGIDGLLFAGHDISDGGLITCLLEMAFAGNCSVEADFNTDNTG